MKTGEKISNRFGVVILAGILCIAIGLNGCSLKKEDEYQDRIVNGIINKDADEIMECFCDELKTDETMKEVKSLFNKIDGKIINWDRADWTLTYLSKTDGEEIVRQYQNDVKYLHTKTSQYELLISFNEINKKKPKLQGVFSIMLFKSGTDADEENDPICEAGDLYVDPDAGDY